jgi:hypothetical protein
MSVAWKEANKLRKPNIKQRQKAREYEEEEEQTPSTTADDVQASYEASVVDITNEEISVPAATLHASKRAQVAESRTQFLSKVESSLVALNKLTVDIENTLQTLATQIADHDDPVVVEDKHLGTMGDEGVVLTIGSGHYKACLNGVLDEHKSIESYLEPVKLHVKNMQKKHRQLERALVEGTIAVDYQEFMLTDKDLFELCEDPRTRVRVRPYHANWAKECISDLAVNALEWTRTADTSPQRWQTMSICMISHRIMCDSPRMFVEWSGRFLRGSSQTAMIKVTHADGPVVFRALHQCCNAIIARRLNEFPEYTHDHRIFPYDKLAVEFELLGRTLRSDIFTTAMPSRGKEATTFCDMLPRVMVALCESKRPDTADGSNCVSFQSLKSLLIDLLSTILLKCVLATCSPQSFGMYDDSEVDVIVSYFQVGMSCHVSNEWSGVFTLVNTMVGHVQEAKFVDRLQESSTNITVAMQNQLDGSAFVVDEITQLKNQVYQNWSVDPLCRQTPLSAVVRRHMCADITALLS